MSPRVSMIVAVADNGVIGRDGGLPWRLSNDLRHFKATTMGHHIVMGRKTYESIGRPLPGRTTIVVSRDASYRAEGCTVVSTLDEAIRVATAAGDDDVFIVGGAQLYALAWPRADRMHVTHVHAEVDGDTYFEHHPLDLREWHERSRQRFSRSERDEHDYSVVVYERTPVASS